MPPDDDRATSVPSALTATAAVEHAVLHHAAVQAMRAPSIHNTQPWRFVVTRDALEVHADRRYQLTVLDPRARQLTISCGCAVLNARVAVTAAGYEPDVTRWPDPHRPDLVARIALGPPARPVRSTLADLEPALGERRTNRRAFADEPLPTAVVGHLAELARAEGATTLTHVTKPQDHALVVRLSTLAEQVEQADPACRAEIMAWTSDDPRRADGVLTASIPYRGPGVGSEGWPPIRRFDQRGAGWLPSDTGSPAVGSLLVLASDGDERDAWLHTGEALERVWLELTRLGFWVSPLTQATELRSTRDELRDHLRLPGFPQLLLRAGRAPDVPATRRRPAAEQLREET